MRGSLQITLSIFVFVFASNVIASNEKVQVTICDGTLEGLVLNNYDGKQFYGFKQIPYAEPPVGDYRFKVC